MAHNRQKVNLTRDLVAHYGVPSGAGWAAKRRAAARSRLMKTGLPTKHDEYWKYSNPIPLTDISVPTIPKGEINNDTVFNTADYIKIIFVDGVFDATHSDDLSDENITIETLNTVTHKDIHWCKDLFGVLESNGQTPIARSLAALNTAVAPEGLVIRATGVVKRPLSIRYLHRGAYMNAMVHHVIKVDVGAKLSVIESCADAGRFNCVMEVDVADGAEFHHVRLHHPIEQRLISSHIFTRLGAESIFKSFSMAAGGKLTRNEVVIEMTDHNAKADIAGICIGDGEDFHHDDTVFVIHKGRNCHSRQVFKKVLNNGASGVFQGKILVKADAQKTDGYQIAQALLSDCDSRFFAKPELEIYADDVICSHGSTVGTIDEDALFYLLSRGIALKQAQNMLIIGFLSTAIKEISSQSLSNIAYEKLLKWLA